MHRCVKFALANKRGAMYERSRLKVEPRSTSRLIKKPKNGLLPNFSPDLTRNRQIWLFYPEKWIFFKKLGTLLNQFAPGDFAEKDVLKILEWFSGHCPAIKS